MGLVLHLGQEIYSFFYKYGKNGIYGIILTSILIGIIIYRTLIISKNNNINTYEEFLNLIINNQAIKNIIKNIINIFLLFSFYIMVAGISAYLNQQFNLNKIVSSSIFCIFCYFIFNNNIEKIIKINSIIVPILILIILIFGLKNLNYIKYSEIIEKNNYWILSSILYMSYNTITLIGITAVLNKYIKNKTDCLYIAIITGIIIFIMALIIFFLLGNLNNKEEIPILSVSKLFGGVYIYLYSVMIFFAIFTTAISNGYAFIKNISEKNNRIINIIICTTAVPISILGFSNLVNILYPLFGIAGLIQIIFILKGIKKINI